MNDSQPGEAELHNDNQPCKAGLHIDSQPGEAGLHTDSQSCEAGLHIDNQSGEAGLHIDYQRMIRRIQPGRLQQEMLFRAARFRHTGQTAGEAVSRMAEPPAGQEKPGSRTNQSQDTPYGQPGRNSSHPLLAIDATAGMGEDSILLAAAGYTVEMYEKNPVTAALLRESLRQAATYPELAAILKRLHLHEGDSIYAMRHWADPVPAWDIREECDKGIRREEGRRDENERRSLCQSPDPGPHQKPAPDLVYLDPMFPARAKSAKVKKKLQLLQQLEQPEDEQGQADLLEAAIQANPRRIIIKRPAKGAYLAGRKPGYSIQGKVIRYDVIVIR